MITRSWPTKVVRDEGVPIFGCLLPSLTVPLNHDYNLLGDLHTIPHLANAGSAMHEAQPSGDLHT